jgi:hypothetical protein
LVLGRAPDAPHAAHDVDLARARHAGDAAHELRHDAFLEFAQRVEIDRGRAVTDSVRRHPLHFVHHEGRVQQRLRRNAADVEANAAERREALDEDRLHPEIRGAESRGIAAGARAQHEHLAFDVGCSLHALARAGERRCACRSGSG